MTTDITRNDRAYIQISKEMRQLQNAVKLCDVIISFQENIQKMERTVSSSYSNNVPLSVRMTKQIEEIGPITDNLPEELRGLGGLVEGVTTKFKSIPDRKTQFQERIRVLGNLMDAYDRGEDIVLTKLSNEE